MNVYDGQRIEGMLRARGLSPTGDIAAADLIVLNTCAVREKASNKVFSELGRIRDQKKPGALFGIVGCVAREEGANSFRRIPELNFVLGPQSYHKLPEILDNPDARLLNVDLSGLEKFDGLASFFIPHSSSLAYIPIQEGCDHCCTYCIVPFTRGRELSRPFGDIMRDVRAAAGAGAAEICFLGQNVNGYRYKSEAARAQSADVDSFKSKDDSEPSACNSSALCAPRSYNLADLIKETAEIESVRRIRFTSSYPTEMTDDLIALFGAEPKLLPFLNMPIQSGSPNVLTRMNRPYSLDLYIDIVRRLRDARPDIQISSDFIVGFPGETDEDFNQTMEIVKCVRYTNSYVFKYSPRPHTAAALMSGQIPENIKRQRLAALDGLLNEINREFNESCVGRIMPCLIEGPDKTGRHLLARTPYMQQAIIEASTELTAGGASKPCAMCPVKITSANKCSLRGKIAEFSKAEFSAD
jgi:tRNA-2-methylthio-N6-dimethylallyladenosine synthase